MAKLTEIFSTSSEDMTDTQKVAAIAEIVQTAREQYGNTDAEITAPEIGTCDGVRDLKLLSDKDKVAVAEMEVDAIITKAVEETKSAEGVVLDREIERLIATSQVLTNITAKVDSAYI